ncbi:hypothetical protein A0256_10230 [Mucilaginibacter sp. PAMC 26640]|nr:hypothetical protein A0256_10230 [Mucilaginibacter sp. PAMC 26640]
MDTLTINIINPKALKLIEDLAEMDLISIQQEPKKDLENILEQLRANSQSAPSMEEITQEVEAVRAQRYGK